MKIAIDMSLSKYVQSDLCGRNATDWGKCFNNNEQIYLKSCKKTE